MSKMTELFHRILRADFKPHKDSSLSHVEIMDLLVFMANQINELTEAFDKIKDDFDVNAITKDIDNIYSDIKDIRGDIKDLKKANR